MLAPNCPLSTVKIVPNTVTGENEGARHKYRCAYCVLCENNLLQMFSPDAHQVRRRASVWHQQQLGVDDSRSVNESWQLCAPAQRLDALNDLRLQQQQQTSK